MYCGDDPLSLTRSVFVNSRSADRGKTNPLKFIFASTNDILKKIEINFYFPFNVCSSTRGFRAFPANTVAYFSRVRGGRRSMRRRAKCIQQRIFCKLSALISCCQFKQIFISAKHSLPSPYTTASPGDLWIKETPIWGYKCHPNTADTYCVRNVSSTLILSYPCCLPTE